MQANRRPYQTQYQFIVLAAIWAEGHAVLGQVDRYATGRPMALGPDDIESALETARRANANAAGGRFYSALRDRLHQRYGPNARMPHTPIIREACERLGVVWNDAWLRSPAQAWSERHRAAEAAVEPRQPAVDPRAAEAAWYAQADAAYGPPLDALDDAAYRALVERCGGARFLAFDCHMKRDQRMLRTVLLKQLESEAAP